MSSFREIWREAIGSGQEMMLKPQSAKQRFDQLLSKHGQDGMIFYERGEAAEYLGDVKSAERDYSKAVRLLPLEHWRVVARRSLARVRHELDPTNPGPGKDLQWDAFHDVHGVPRAPDKVRVRALSALARIDSEVDSALMDLRSCLEEVVVDQLRSVSRRDWPKTLEEKIELLKSHEIAPSDIVKDMHQVRQIGNKGAHTDRTIERRDIDSAISTFVRVLRHFYAES